MAEFDSTRFLKSLTVRPGVYQMKDADGHILYVGKAKNLKVRVSSYWRRTCVEDDGNGGQDCAYRYYGHAKRGGGVAARAKPDQGFEAPLQYFVTG